MTVALVTTRSSEWYQQLNPYGSGKMLIKDLVRRLKSFPPKAMVRASVGDGPTVHQLRLAQTDHHNPPADIVKGKTPFGHIETEIDGIKQVEIHPVEVFAAHAWGGSASSDRSVGSLVTGMGDYPDDALVRVAVPGDGHHRLLDINGIGFSSNTEEVNGELVVELTCERWDSGYPVVRADSSESV